MHLASFSALVFVASTLASTISIEVQPEEDNINLTDIESRDLSPCGVAVSVGGFIPSQAKGWKNGLQRNAILKVTTSTKEGGGDEKDITNNECTKDCTRSWGPTDSPAYYKDDPTVGSFTLNIYPLNGKHCNEEGGGENCDPVISFPNGWTAHMMNNPACTGGTRRPAFDAWSQWWRCQVMCK